MEHYPKLANLFQYPEEGFQKNISVICNEIKENYPKTENLLSDFEIFLNERTSQELQEYFVKTFEVKALCVMEVGYVLFGEDYKRGEFLVNIQNEHNKVKNDCKSELGDYLPNMLNLLPKIEDKNFADELGHSIMVPAIKQMVTKFLDKTNVYLNVLKALVIVLEKDYAHLSLPQYQIPDVSSKQFFKKMGGCAPGHCKPQKQQF